MGIFDGILITTDLDGTLLREDKTISEKNIEAIEYFKKNGGFFTVVTGRMPNFVEDIANQVKPNVPVGCVNGAALYDYENRKYLWKSEAPKEIFDIVRCVDEKFPQMGIQVCTFSNSYFCKDNYTMKRFREITNAKNLVRRYTEISEPVAKIILGSESDEEMAELRKTLDNHPYADKFEFIRSEKVFYDVMPKGIFKGTAIIKICERCGIDINKTIAIGDYNNDISMFSVSKVGIAVSNACDDAKKAADYVTVSNEEDAVARVIYEIEEGKYL